MSSLGRIKRFAGRLRGDTKRNWMAGDLATPGNENARLSGYVFSATYEYFRKNPIPFSNTCLPRQPREMPNEIGMTGSATPDNENTPIRAATYFQQLVRISGRTQSRIRTLGAASGLYLAAGVTGACGSGRRYGGIKTGCGSREDRRANSTRAALETAIARLDTAGR